MFFIPKPIKNLIEAFEKLPGIGPKTAQRLAFYLLHVPQVQLDEFSIALSNLKKNTFLCSRCYNISDSDPCSLCQIEGRDRKTICVVEQPLDLLAIEKIGRYNGVYHVLHGAISPINNIGPEELYLNQFLSRIKNEEIKEVILATNPSLEGEATAMYILQEIKRQEEMEKKQQIIKVTRIARGLPTGGDLEYADDLTLIRAIEGRQAY